ncbi:MAG TPA: hypothetical protein VES88_07685 [Gemmatimonadaceae bacterium]|nr:hypothetical protein [Gemmatimonadaceae bacterium]
MPSAVNPRLPESIRLSGPAGFFTEVINDGDGFGTSADVYALGCVAYWLLTGKFVFDMPNATAMRLPHPLTA